MSMPFPPQSKVDRRKTAQAFLQQELDELPAEERHVVERFIAKRGVARNIEREFHEARTFGERVADRVAAVGGSWRFIICFGIVLVIWMVANSFMLAKAFDPYPYILLNLVLSCLAAVQAPIIMMSQNRQAERDRFMAAKDYEINLKAEIEVLGLHTKIDLQVLKEIKDMREQVDFLCAELKKMQDKST